MYIIFIVFGIAIIIGIINYKRQKNFDDEKEETEEEKPTYTKKESLVTNNELNFYKKLENVFGNKYKVQTQINLASIIDKNNSYYKTDLFRNIDYGIFDKNTLKPLVLIELNDSTHKNKKRYERDLKIREMLKEANIPLVTFYTTYENKEEYIKNRIEKILNNQ